MTTGQKWLGLLLLQAGLLGGAYGGGRYPEWKKRQVAEDKARQDYEKLETDSRKAYDKLATEARQSVLLTRARAVLMEAALAARYGNYGMAFERVIRAQTAAQNLKLPLQKEFDELSALLIAQKPEILEKILALADKIEPPARLVPSELAAGNRPAAMMVPPPGAPALIATTASTGTPAPATTPHALPAASPAAPPAAVPQRGGQPDGAVEQSRASLLAAKELLIAGSEPGQVIPKLAHAQVLLEEGGHAEFSEQFATAIKALRAHDATKARSTLDAVLTSLRGL